MGPQTLWVSNNQAFDMKAPPPSLCKRCGQMHSAQFPCCQPSPVAAAIATAHKPRGNNTHAMD